MDNQPAFDRSILFPMSIGIFSIVGIVIVLLVGRALNSPAEIPATPSATRFQYLYLGTEPAISTSLVDELEVTLTDEPVEEPFPEPLEPTVAFSTPTPPVLVLLTPTSAGSTPTQPVTATLSSPVAANTIDDTNPLLKYNGNGWIGMASVSGAYQGTLHRSDIAGDFVGFTFTGQEIRVLYQTGPGFGTITITIDNVGGPPISQAEAVTQIREWRPASLLSAESHTIVITHSGGGSVNIDSIVVPGPTPTPTRTVTPTP